MTKKEIYIGLGILALGGVAYYFHRQRKLEREQQAYLLQQAQLQAQQDQYGDEEYGGGSVGGGGGGGGFIGGTSELSATPTTTIITPSVVAPIAPMPTQPIVESAAPTFSKPMSTTMISGSTQAANLLPQFIAPKAGIGESGSAFQPSSTSFGSTSGSAPAPSMPSAPMGGNISAPTLPKATSSFAGKTFVPKSGMIK